MSWSDEDRVVHRDADAVREMAGTRGWEQLARWCEAQAQIERDEIERGARSWDDYQRSVGRLDAFRKVLARPEELVKASEELIRGDTNE